MDQSRQVTARFSSPGTITYTPGSVSFSVQQGAAPPASVVVSAANTGERSLQLDATIAVSYTPSGTAWLGVSIDRFVIDTLVPANLTLSVASAATKLPAGTYQASVIVFDSGRLFSWVLPVTLTVTPPPTPPTISNIVASVLQLNDAQRCTLSTPYATSFTITFDYTDPNGDGPATLPQAGLGISYVFQPRLDSGSFSNYTYLSSLTGNGSTGSANTVQCYRFGTNTSVDVTMTIQDLAGLRSAGATTSILKPAGSN